MCVREAAKSSFLVVGLLIGGTTKKKKLLFLRSKKKKKIRKRLPLSLKGGGGYGLSGRTIKKIETFLRISKTVM